MATYERSKYMGDVDGLLRILGQPGRYQVLVYILLCFNYLPVSFNHVVMALYKYVPRHYCAQPQGSFNNISVSSCMMSTAKPLSNNTSTIVTSNQQQPCQYGWVYEWQSSGEETISTEWDLVCGDNKRAGQSTSIYFAGVMLGGLVFGTISDKLGRKPVMLVCLYLNVVAGLAIYFIQSFIGFSLLRFCQGFLLQGVQSVTYVLIMEMFVAEHRTYSGVVIECFWSFGVMWLALVGYLLRHWRYIQLAITLPTLITVTYIWLVPESVRWLLARGKYNHAEQVLKQLCRRNGVSVQELNFTPPEITEEKYTLDHAEKNQVDAAVSPQPRYTVLDMFKTPVLRKHSALMFYIWFTSALVYYGLTLSTSDLGGNRYLNLFLSGAVEMPAYLSSIYIVSRFGRRYPLIIYFVLSGVSCILSTVIPSGEVLTDVSKAMALLGKFSTAGCMSIIFLYASELFPTLIRNVSFGACAFWLRVGALVAPQINSLDKESQSGAPVIVFGCCALVAAILTAFLPETLDKKLPESVEEAEKLGFLRSQPAAAAAGDVVAVVEPVAPSGEGGGMEEDVPLTEDGGDRANTEVTKL